MTKDEVTNQCQDTWPCDYDMSCQMTNTQTGPADTDADGPVRLFITHYTASVDFRTIELICINIYIEEGYVTVWVESIVYICNTLSSSKSIRKSTNVQTEGTITASMSHKAKVQIKAK